MLSLLCPGFWLQCFRAITLDIIFGPAEQVDYEPVTSTPRD